MIQGKWVKPGDSLAELLPLREEIFHQGQDALDNESWNAIIYHEGVPAAIGRIWWEDGVYRIGGVGVLPQLRGRRLGDLVTRLLLFKAQQHSAREVALTCSPEVSGFFARYGFETVSSTVDSCFMTLDALALCLDSCQGCHHCGE